jgi:hypothetical protein
MYTKIPSELRVLRRWLCWKYATLENGKKTKIPLQPSGTAASVTDPTTWVDFNIAVDASKKFDGIGFVLVKGDGYTIIDLDNKPEKPATPEQLDRHSKILESFNSYAERSVSGTGVHIVVKGQLPSGVHRDNVEAYSDGRYMAFTGDVLRDSPIKDYQELLMRLYGEMKPAETATLVEIDPLLEDSELVEMAMRATNADKFNRLCAGQWQDEYESQSEADFALLSILAFYTQSNEQVRRIFRMTALGKREKAIRNNVYIDKHNLEKIRGQQPAVVDFTKLLANAAALPAPKVEATLSNQPAQTFQSNFPPGFIGELAQYFFETSIRPVREISLAAAIGCVAGVIGKSYNISGQGLSQYLILIAQTGTGKEAISSGISRMFMSIRDQIPMVTDFLGPAVFASGPALHRVLSEKPCFVSILGEFGYTVQRLSNPKANAAELTLKQLILDAYGKSGHGQILQASVYSDREKNVNPVASPNITILGETTPSTFYESLDESMVASGFLSRFLILEYTGDRPDLNPNFNAPPSDSLKSKFRDLVTIALTTSSNHACCPVASDAEGQKTLDNFNHFCDTKIRGSKEAVREIWNRAHLKALKLSGLIAVGCNPHNPVVTKSIADWCCNLISHDCASLQAKFVTGDIGTGDSKQIHDVKRVTEAYFGLPFKEATKYGATEKLFAAKIVTYQYLMRKTNQLASFRNDKLGSTLALKRTLQSMIDMGLLRDIPKVQLQQNYDYAGTGYGISNHWYNS